MSHADNVSGPARIPNSLSGSQERTERVCRENLSRLLAEVRRSSSAFSRVYYETLGDAEAEESVEPLLTSLLEVVAAAERGGIAA